MGKKIHGMDIILAIMATLTIIFTGLMIYTFWTYGSVPDTLIISFFAAFSCEGGFMAGIKVNKDKRNNKDKPEPEPGEDMTGGVG